ncbi:hypothetical protein ACFVT2_21015 [Streptomyces sp. NPDC058000]|uniref:HNH endonuclease n=1 Tax=Streptomyces sp. NPDC058000 TaxID=3346299 RepID=UPI0036EE9FFF
MSAPLRPPPALFFRHLKDLRTKGRVEVPAWVQRMAARRCKTLVACRSCHEAIHAGRPTRQPSRI